MNENITEQFFISPSAANPPIDCQICPRLAEYRTCLKNDYPDWFNSPVPVYGDLSANLLIVGLAPGKKGANRTGKPFHGDAAGELLYPYLEKYKLAQLINTSIAGELSNAANNILATDKTYLLKNSCIINAVRCVPPKNLPTSLEVNQCNQWLKKNIILMHNLKCIITLGGVAHKGVTKSLGLKTSDFPFIHGKASTISEKNLSSAKNNCVILSSYHPSRYNLNTKRITEKMFDDIINTAANIIS